MDPVRNPYAPGAGQRPPELAGRDDELAAFEVVLERVSPRPAGPLDRAHRPARRRQDRTCSTQPAALRSVVAGAGGKLEARPDQPLRWPLAAALHVAIRELSGVPSSESRHVLGVLKSFAQRRRRAGSRHKGDVGPDGGRSADRRGRGSRASMSRRSSAGQIPATSEIDLVELLVDIAGLAAGSGRGVALFIDEMQDVGPQDVSRAVRGLPRTVPATAAARPRRRRVCRTSRSVLAASKSYSERLFRYHRIDRLDRGAADARAALPARDEDADFDDEALEAMYAATSGYPYFIQAYGKVAWDVAPRSPDHRRRRQGRRTPGRSRARRGFLRIPVRARHSGRA